MTNFLAELATRYKGMILPTPSTGFPRSSGIYELDISDRHLESNYWTDWGGTMDEFHGTNIDLYYGQFLEKVNSSAELLSTANSIWVDLANKMAYINIPKHPWLYADHETEAENVIPFLSYALNPANPSNNILRGVNVLTKFETPSFSVKISDNISGITLSQGFTVNLYNDDGYFDDDDKWDLFNTPVYIRKASKNNPAYEDFRLIRYGLSGSTNSGLADFSIECNDRFTGLSDPVCDVGSDGKNIQRLYGVNTVKLNRVNDTTYTIPADPVSSSGAVLDKDGNSVSYTRSGNTITVAAAAKPDTIVITGNTSNRIGAVIKDLLLNRAGLQYNASNFNTAEFDWYVSNSPPVNIAFTGGDIKKAIDEVLKSDMAYLIQQSDMRFTIRKWGLTYAAHTIEDWIHTQNLTKNYDQAHENYFSSCTIKYNYVDDDNYSAYFYGDNEAAAEDRYRKKYFEDEKFQTHLTNEADARALATLLSGRFSFLKQHIKAAVGFDTVGFELLDTVTADLTINRRQFSKATQFVITGINPASDVLDLEEI